LTAQRLVFGAAVVRPVHARGAPSGRDGPAPSGEGCSVAFVLFRVAPVLAAMTFSGCTGLITVERSQWRTCVTETKGMKYRVVPMTKRLQTALAAHRHLRGERVLYTDDGETVTAKVLQKWMVKAQKRAGLRATGAMHILRHTFCSHLAMRGAPALSIQKLAGHEDLATTLGYMHLAQGEAERAIRLLDEPSPLPSYGNGTATEGAGQ
jgi:hypothetical protein